MKRATYIISILSVIILLGSCTAYKTSIPQVGVQAQVNVSMSDLEYLKDVTGTATQSYVIWLPIGGTKYKQASLSSVGGSFINLNLSNRGINNALYQALQSVPDADFVLPIAAEVVSNRMFLGREDSVTVKVKAFKLKVQ